MSLTTVSGVVVVVGWVGIVVGRHRDEERRRAKDRRLAALTRALELVDADGRPAKPRQHLAVVK